MILVTGGTGLLGSHLLLHLLGTEETVTAIYRPNSDLEKVRKVFSYYHKDADTLFSKINWAEADLNDIPALEKAFEGVTHVYHCAALISFDPKDYEILRKINVDGTSNIVNLCIENHVEKLCYASSIATIGKSINEPATEETEWSGQDHNVYALTKYDAELEVWRGSQEGLPVVMVNPGLIVGPGFWNSGSGKLFTVAAKGSSYYPPGGTGFVTVDDVVSIMKKIMESPNKNHRFITVGQNLTYHEILERIASTLNRKVPTKAISHWQLQILWRLDWLRTKLTMGERKLSKIAVASLKHRQRYSSKKVMEFLGMEFNDLTETIRFSCNLFKEENP